MAIKKAEETLEPLVDAAEEEELCEEATGVRARFVEVEAKINAISIGHTDLVRGLLLAILAREHMMLIGPYGSAKTSTINAALTLLGVGARAFYATLDKMTPPEVLLGMFSPRALLKEDRWLRNMVGKLPEAEFAFIGEVFRGSGAVRASLHTVINERYVENDGVRVAVPLCTMFADSNTFPYRDEDRPFYDRFVLRHCLEYLPSSESDPFCAMLKAPELGNGTVTKAVMTAAEVHEAMADVRTVTAHTEIGQLLFELRAALAEEGVQLSDRRWKRSLHVLQASAWLRGASTIDTVDFGALIYVLWETKDQVAIARAKLEPYAASSLVEEETRQLVAATEIFNDAMASSSDERCGEAMITLAEILERLTNDDHCSRVTEMVSQIENAMAGDIAESEGDDIPF